MTRYSIVIPLYNEERTIPELQRRLALTLETMDGPVEVILVDDGSNDSSFALLTQIHRKTLGSNSCGCRGTSAIRSPSPPESTWRAETPVILMDGDLQDPPELPHQHGGSLE